VIALRAPGAGAPLAGAVRAPLERSLGIDLGAVRVHGDAAARAAVAATGARALAFGPRIFLGPRESGADLGVMAHEVAHVVQQQGGATMQRLGGDTGGLEREAVAAAGAVGRGEAFEVTGRTRARPMFLFDSLRRAASAAVGAVGDVIGTALGWVRERANAIPGYRLISLILRRDPLTGEAVAFSTANLLRAMLELNPIGTVIRVALDRYGIVDRVADFVDQQMATLAGVLGSIGGAVMAFLRGLGPLDIVSPGAVIDRARRLIEEPIARMRAFIGTLTEGIATFVRDAVLRPLAELASRTRAWDLLCAVLGRNPITGEAVARNAETLIGGFMKLIGQEEVWENIKRGNAVARAWAWFQGTLAGVLAFVRELPQRFLDTLRSLSIGDLVAPLAAFGRIAGTFGAFVGQFLGWAGGQVLRLLEIIVEVVAPAILPYLKRAAGAFGTIIRDPIRFVGNLVRAALTGFRQFGANILDHLRTGLIGWLTGAMGGTGVHIPTALSLSEILKFVLSVLGLTWQAVRLRLVRVVGETAVAGLEQGFDMVRRLVTEGPAAAWQMIVEAVGNLRDMVVEQVMGFVRSRIVQAAITRLIASLNPAGAFIQAILAIYNTIMFLVERLQQIAQVAAGVIDSIAAIAGGVISQAANAVERTAARLLPVVIAFLARLIGLGNVGEVVTRFLDRVRRPIERALERLVNWIVAQARRLGRAVVQTAGDAWAWLRERLGFRNQSGESHTLLFRGNGSSARMMIATEEKPIEDYLNAYEPKTSDDYRTARTVFNDAKRVIFTPAARNEAERDRRARVRVELAKVSAAFARLASEPPRAADYGTKTPAKYGNPAEVEILFGTALPGSVTGPWPRGRSGYKEIFDAGLTTATDKWVQMHIISEKLGGSGTDFGNLVPAPNSVNTGPFRSFELSTVALAKAKNANIRNRIWVEVLVDGTKSHPTAISGKAGLWLWKGRDASPRWMRAETPSLSVNARIPQPQLASGARKLVVNFTSATEMTRDFGLSSGVAQLVKEGRPYSSMAVFAKSMQDRGATASQIAAVINPGAVLDGP
jgi:hypothetical protein